MLGTSSDRRYSYQNGTIQDPEMDGLSLYEKKTLLVNRELDSFGMGKYQVLVICHAVDWSWTDWVAVVHILFMWIWIPIGSAVCPCLRAYCSCIATRTGVFKWEPKMLSQDSANWQRYSPWAGKYLFGVRRRTVCWSISVKSHFRGGIAN